jgi:hypothetical protein
LQKTKEEEEEEEEEDTQVYCNPRDHKFFWL